jgi:hypothetical protein
VKSLSELIFWRVFNIWNHCATTSMLLGKVNSVGQNIFDKMPAQTSNTSTTTISTVVLQRHSTTIVIALLQSGIHIHLKVNYQKDFFFTSYTYLMILELMHPTVFFGGIGTRNGTRHRLFG